MTSKPRVIFVLGAPGAGKGTQCQKIVEKFGYVHLSAGDLLRAERKNPNSQYGDLIEEHIRNGIIVPVEITCHLLDEAMKKSFSNKFLIDGFPRNKNNLDGWKQEMSDKTEVLYVLFIDCSEAVCIERCLKRGQEGSGRSDDNVESLKKRFHTFHHDTMPIVEYYEKKNMVIKVDGSKDPDTVFQSISKVLESCE